MKHLAAVCLLSAALTLPVSDVFGWGAVTGPRGGAAYRGPMGGAAVRGPYAGQSPEDLPVVWRLVDHTAVLPTVAHMVGPRCAALTEEPL